MESKVGKIFLVVWKFFKRGLEVFFFFKDVNFCLPNVLILLPSLSNSHTR